MKDVRLLEMQVFKSVADNGGFTAAGRVLGASQPFLSRTLNRLEKRLGVALMRRSTRRISLTDEGKAFLASCNKIIDEIDAAEQRVSSESAAISGDLRVTAGTSFGTDQIVPILPAFMEKYPRVRICLSLSDVQADVIGDRVDVAIRMGQLRDSMLLSRRLCHLQRLIVASPSYLERYGMPRHPDNLSKHNCTIWEAPLDHLNLWPFMIEGRRKELRMSGNFVHSNGVAATEICLAGIAIARMAEHVALPAVRAGKLVVLLKQYQARDDTAVYAIYPKERQVHPRTRAFVNFLVERFKHAPWT